MKYIISLVAWISGFLVALFLMPVALLCATFLGTKGMSIAGKVVSRLFVAGLGIWVKCEGRKEVDLSRSHLFMANHASFIDFFVLAGYLPGIVRGLEAAEHFSWPIWGTFLRRAGLIPIDRSNPRASLASISLAAQRLKEGVSMLILPEGTRTRDGELLPLKKLPFKLAKKSGGDIIPVGLVGTFKIKPKTTWVIKPGIVLVRFGKPIPEEVVANSDIETLKEITRKRLLELAGEKPD